MSSIRTDIEKIETFIRKFIDDQVKGVPWANYFGFWEYFFYLFIIFEMVYMAWLQLLFLEKLHLIEQLTLSDFISTVIMLPNAYALFKLQHRWDGLFAGAGTKAVP